MTAVATAVGLLESTLRRLAEILRPGRPLFGDGRGANSPSVAIIGAGAGGLATAVKLKQAGFENFQIFERSDGVGGVWRTNDYPGAACDVMSHFYSFSFLPNPGWSRTFATQQEILAYFERCADHFGLYSHLRTGTEIDSARWDEAESCWHLTSASGEEFQADVLVSALGLFSEPKIPEIDGLERFGGSAFHSSSWKHSHDLRYERVAVIGTGPTAIQFVPEIAARVDHLDVFQREPGWVIPKPDRAYSLREKWRFAHIPLAARLHRFRIFLRGERVFLVRATGKKQEAKRALALAHLEAQVPDEALRRQLTPNYPIGCKRTLLSNDYYPALMRSNVELISGSVQNVTYDGVVGPDGIERPVDTIIFATGFKATEYLASVQVEGRDSRKLADEWSDGAQAYLGMTVPSFPNLFILYGPNTNALTSLIFILECQAGYVLQAVRCLAEQGGGSLDVKKSVADRFSAEIAAGLKGTVWLGGCTTYFRDEHGNVTTQYPFRAYRYWLSTKWLRRSDFRWGKARSQ